MSTQLQELAVFRLKAEQITASLHCPTRNCFYFSSWSGEVCRISRTEIESHFEIHTVDFRTPIVGLTYCPGENVLIAAAASGMVFSLSVISLQPTKEVALTPDGISSSASLDSGGCVAAGGKDGSVYFVRANDLSVDAVQRCHSDRVTSLAVSWDQKTIVSGAADGSIALLSARDGLREIRHQCHSGAVMALDCSSRSFVASGGQDNLIMTWESHPRLRRKAVFVGHTSSNRGISFDGTAKEMFTVSQDRTLKIWSVADAECEVTRRLDDTWLTCVAFDNHKHLMATGSLGGVVRIWKCE